MKESQFDNSLALPN